MNLRRIDGIPVFAGNQVAIDDGTVEYESVCAKCHARFRDEAGADAAWE
jgi:thymidine kinase